LWRQLNGFPPDFIGTEMDESGEKKDKSDKKKDKKSAEE
jgi:hypothetical protein